MELPLFVVGVIGVVVLLLWRSRRGSSPEGPAGRLADADRPDHGDGLEVARVHIGTTPGPGGSDSERRQSP